MLIELTNERFEKFQLNCSLIQTIAPMMGNKSYISLTNGNYCICLENPKKVAAMVNQLLSKEGDHER